LATSTALHLAATAAAIAHAEPDVAGRFAARAGALVARLGARRVGVLEHGTHADGHVGQAGEDAVALQERVHGLHHLP
jgi:hypothetical protein